MKKDFLSNNQHNLIVQVDRFMEKEIRVIRLRQILFSKGTGGYKYKATLDYRYAKTY